MDIPIDKLRTAPPEAVQKLKTLGIDTVEKFHDIACHSDTRAELAEKSGIPDAILEAWSSEADNMIIIAQMMRK